MECRSSTLVITIPILRYDFSEIIHTVNDDILILSKGIAYQRHELRLVLDTGLAAESHRCITMHVADSTVINQSGNHTM